MLFKFLPIGKYSYIITITKMKQSNQRTIILNYLRSVKTHPTARQVYDAVRKVLPHISFATVYRNLNQLREEGVILELSYANKASHYDGNPNNHYHFSCQICGQVADLDSALPLEQVQSLIGSQIKGQVLGYRLEFNGICENCQNKEEG